MNGIVRKGISVWFFALLATLSLPFGTAFGASTSEGDDGAGGQTSFEEIAIISKALEPWTGDLDGIIERGQLRVSIPHNPLAIHYDGEKRLGFAVEIERELEKFLKEKLKKKIEVILMPMPRNQLLAAVIDGRADISMGNWTITPERQETLAFTDPVRSGVNEIVVTGPTASDVRTFDDLVEHNLFIRPSSSYFAHLQDLNAVRADQTLAAIPYIEASPYLEDYDLLDMLNAGAIDAITVDDHKAQFWAELFENITLHPGLSLNEGGEIAWALRPDNPKLLDFTNGFMATIKKGTLLGNILLKRYVTSTDWVQNIRDRQHLGRYDDVAPFIQAFSGEYGFDWVIILAQAFQESKLDHNLKSKRGAVGVMQVLPATAADKNVGIKNIEKLENNVHAGVKYLRFLRDRYFSDPEIETLDRVLMSFAAYNAGPANIAKSRKRAVEMGLDPNVWFENVETATAKTVSHEPVTYVRNIFKYYVSYQLSMQTLLNRQRIVEEIEQPG